MIDEQTLIKKRLEDMAAMRDRYQYTVFSKFLTPAQSQLAEGLCGCALWGGYEHAQRKMAAMYPDYIGAEEIEWDMAVVRAYTTDKAVHSHRDWLGSLIALGIKRETVGDILVSGDTAQIICTAGIAEYISQNLISVSRSKTKREITDIKNLEVPELLFRDIRGSVPSLRLDCIVALATGKSRSHATKLISGGFVQVNYKETQSLSHQLKDGDTITVRGCGKFIFQNTENLTKKGRLYVNLRKYI